MKCFQPDFENANACSSCGKRYQLLFSRRKQKVPLISSYPFMLPRIFIDDKFAHLSTKCEDTVFYVEEGMHRIDIVRVYGTRGAHFFIEVKRDLKVEYYFHYRLGVMTIFTFLS